jgi:CRISPR-associated protein Cas5h
MKTIVFDIQGEYGHFKKPYSPMSPVTFPFPPPPAVLGLLGAILGLSKTEYHEKLGWDKVRIGIRLKAPVRIFRSGINLLNTKDGTDKYLRPRAYTNTHIQVNYEFLKDPYFRLYIKDLPTKMHEQLKYLLQSERSVFMPVLGLAQCLADINWIGEIPTKLINSEHTTVHSVLSLKEGIEPIYKPGQRYQRTRIPAEMDSERIVHRYQEILLSEDAVPIECYIDKETEVFQVGDETISFL